MTHLLPIIRHPNHIHRLLLLLLQQPRQINLPTFHNQQQMPFTPPRPSTELTINQLNNPIIPIQSLKQRDLIHIPAHGIRVRLVKRDAFDRVDLVRDVHHAVDA